MSRNSRSRIDRVETFGRCLAASFAVAICFLTASSNVGAQVGLNAPSKFEFEVDLRGRHPELFENSEFASWKSAGKSVGPWHETAIDGQGKRLVVVQNPEGDSVFAAQIVAKAAKVERTSVIDLRELKRTRMNVLATVTARGKSQGEIVAVRPVVTPSGSAEWELHWEVEIQEGDSIQTFRVGQDRLDLKDTRPFKAMSAERKSDGPIPPTADDSANNEIHHLAAFGVEASAWISGATTVQDKARRIFDRVHSSYSYDATIQYIGEFTWADYLTRDRNGRRGICDEWAVVEISYLRSVGIPARLKFLIWQEGGKPVGHAVLEYSDNGTWRHMDALWNAFNNPAIYRQSGATNVTVMDADYPSDARSTQPAWGVADPTGDGKLYPYGDFIIAPNYPGNARAGYSR